MNKHSFLLLPTSLFAWGFLCAALGSAATSAQIFDSSGLVPFGDPTIDSTNFPSTTFMTADGRLYYEAVTVSPGAIWRFRANAFNTPVYILAAGDIVIDGTIDVSGAAAPNPVTGGAPVGGVSGPGGFHGGKPGFADGVGPGAGYGPGGGLGGGNNATADGAGAGSYAGLFSGVQGQNKRGAVVYGNPLLIPMIGGSGGGGTEGSPGIGGGGGGGALVIASRTRIVLDGSILATGGLSSGSAYNMGSGGAVRLIAPEVRGSGNISVLGGGNRTDNHGRVRVDTLDRNNLNIEVTPRNAMTVGANMFVVPPILPRLDIISAGGIDIPEGTPDPVTIQLPFGTSTNQSVTVQARDFNARVPIELVLTPDSGLPLRFEAEINNTTQNPATVTIPVEVPPNVLITVNAWTR